MEVAAAPGSLAGVRDEMVPTNTAPVAATITIGGVTAPRHARNVAEVLARAQETLDTAKGRRRGSFLAYQPNVEREAQRRENARATDEIVAGLNERRVFLAYETVVAASDRRPAFYECLMRVRRGDGSLVGASEVVPVAERLGLVRLLDHRVLELVVDEMTATPSLQASVNVSPGSTTDPNWWNGLGSLLRAQPGVAERLIIEITESAAIDDIDETRGFVARVKDLGCRIAIDDFGAGYTSFRNLRKLGVDIVKIDGAFVQNMIRSQDDRAFVRTLIDLGKRLKLATVAEWVQDERAARLLESWGCDYIQGALVGLATTERPWLKWFPGRGAVRSGAPLIRGLFTLDISMVGSSQRSRVSDAGDLMLHRAGKRSSRPARALLAQPIDLFLHLVELTLEIVDVAAGLRRRRLAGLGRRLAGLTLAPGERCKHREGALEHFHVPPHLILQRRECADAEGLRHLLAELFLLARQRFDGDFEIARHQHLHAVAIKADELAQKGDRQEILAFLVLLLENDLGEDRSGDILAGLGVVDDEILAGLDHGGEIFERDVGTGAGVVETPVRVLLDGDRFFGLVGFGHWHQA